MVVFPIAATTGLILAATPVAVQSGATQKACGPQAVKDCVQRLMALHDPLSGRVIQRGDAERFCKERVQSC
jgi:hypothetical protein